MLCDKFREYCALSRLERVFLVQAIFWLVVFRVKRTAGSGRFQRAGEAETCSGQGRKRGSALATAVKAARMVSIAANHMTGRFSCLDRSLALLKILEKIGMDGELHLGVRKDRGGFEAHAWVEVSGIVLNDAPDIRSGFIPFPDPVAVVGFYEQ